MKHECGFSIRRPVRKNAQIFAAIYVGADDLVLSDRGAGYTIPRTGTQIVREHRRFDAMMRIQSPEYDVKLSPADHTALTSALIARGWEVRDL